MRAAVLLFLYSTPSQRPAARTPAVDTAGKAAWQSSGLSACAVRGRLARAHGSAAKAVAGSRWLGSGGAHGAWRRLTSWRTGGRWAPSDPEFDGKLAVFCQPRRPHYDSLARTEPVHEPVGSWKSLFGSWKRLIFALGALARRRRHASVRGDVLHLLQLVCIVLLLSRHMRRHSRCSRHRRVGPWPRQLCNAAPGARQTCGLGGRRASAGEGSQDSPNHRVLCRRGPSRSCGNGAARGRLLVCLQWRGLRRQQGSTGKSVRGVQVRSARNSSERERYTRSVNAKPHALCGFTIRSEPSVICKQTDRKTHTPKHPPTHPHPREYADLPTCMRAM